MAARVGKGNSVGVGTGIKAGGHGALFRRWIAAYVGMATKDSEGGIEIK
ncbi:alanine:cation symporter family protein [Clostridioides difficile]|nr:alanine:cation symporter family protein [Clostridioides difficile]